jgi:hypothetical protein
VQEALRMCGVGARRVWSPRQKPFVEGTFNALWTKLSVLSGGQIGRFRGEMERENELLTACQRNPAAHDPRKYFPMFGAAMEAIGRALSERHETPMRGDYGSWAPRAKWEARMGQAPLRRLDEATEWMFRPWAVEWTVRGCLVGGRVRLFEEFSPPFDFSSIGGWRLDQYHGARVKCYFDPYEAPRCAAKVALAQRWQGQAAGTVLGDAVQVNGIADYARFVLGIGLGPDDLGRRQRQQNAAALRREVRNVVGGASLLAVAEERDGIETVARVATDGAGAAEFRGETADTGATSRECGQRRNRTMPAHSASGPDAFAENPGRAELAARPVMGPRRLEERARAAAEYEAENPLQFL